MISGVGTDIIEISRVKSAIENDSFYDKTFTEAERVYIRNIAERAAGYFAAKEAVAKALGTGFSGFRPVDVEILNDDKGKPFVILHGGAKSLAVEMKITVIHISISHNKSFAVAFAAAVTE